MKEKMIRENIRYAKRQMTWFKKNEDIIWVEPQISKIMEEIKKFCLK